MDEAQLDPSFRVACLTVHAVRGPTWVDAGAYDLGARRWLWRERLIPEGAYRSVSSILATPDACAFASATSGWSAGV